MLTRPAVVLAVVLATVAALGQEARSPRALLDAEIARARAHAEALVAIGADLEEEANEERRKATDGQERIDALTGVLVASPPGSPDADRIYDRIVAELRAVRPSLRSALDALDAPTRIPGYVPSIDPSGFQAPGLADAVEAAVSLHSRIAAEEARLRAEEAALRWEKVELRGRRAERLDALRIETLDRLSRSKRRSILGISSDGIAQLRREIEHLTLIARLWTATRLREIEHLPERLRDFFAVGSATWLFLKGVFVIAVVFLVRRRSGRIVEAYRRLVFSRKRTVAGSRRLEAIARTIEVVLPWGAVLVGAFAFEAALGTVAARPEVRVPVRIVQVYSVYRLAIDLVFAATLGLAGRYRLSLDASRRTLLLRSVRTVMRVAVAIVLALVLSSQFLGRGYLYHLVVRFAWIVGILTAFQILAAWRPTIADAYLKLAPSGRLASRVRATKNRWYGVFVVAASFAILAGHAVVVLARDFAMGFDQTRKALAFVFRRRMEKHAESRGYADSPVEDLPEAARAAYSEEAVDDDALLLDLFPGLDTFRERLDAWSHGAGGGSFALAGGTGMGKTTWLSRIDGGEATVDRLRLERRFSDGGDFVRYLGSALGLEEDPVRSLRDGPPRVVVIDAAQNLFLGRIGGYAPLSAFAEIVEETQHRVFWVAAFQRLAWDHLVAVRQEPSVFRGSRILEPWSEASIRDLIRTRTEASRISLTYEDLVIDRMEGVSARSRILETEEGYTRLLWDYADGNPRVALHYWIRSLVPDGPNRARVRLFRTPKSDTLEALGEGALFVLAALATHENLTEREAAAVTGYPPRIAAIRIERLRETGALREDDGGRFRVTTHWNRTVVRLLRRRNLIPR